MPSQVDFAIAAGIFIVFIAILVSYLVNYVTSYSGMTTTSELRSAASNILSVLLGSKGSPENWEEKNYTPVQIGLITDLYRIPIVIEETNGTDRSNMIINISLSFDSNCDKKVWNSTVRVYEGEEEIPSETYNQNFCSNNYLMSADLFFNSSFSANQIKTFFVYFSGEKSVENPTYSLPPVASEDYTIKIYPEEKLSMVSISKLMALKNISYEELVRTLGTDYNINIEMSKK